MLYIMRKFRVGVPLWQADIVEAKVKELRIHIIRRTDYEYEFGEENRVKLYIECYDTEDKLLALVDYLRNDFTGLASIAY